MHMSTRTTLNFSSKISLFFNFVTYYRKNVIVIGVHWKIGNNGYIVFSALKILASISYAWYINPPPCTNSLTAVVTAVKCPFDCRKFCYF